MGCMVASKTPIDGFCNVSTGALCCVVSGCVSCKTAFDKCDQCASGYTMNSRGACVTNGGLIPNVTVPSTVDCSTFAVQFALSEDGTSVPQQRFNITVHRADTGAIIANVAPIIDPRTGDRVTSPLSSDVSGYRVGEVVTFNLTLADIAEQASRLTSACTLFEALLGAPQCRYLNTIRLDNSSIQQYFDVKRESDTGAFLFGPMFIQVSTTADGVVLGKSATFTGKCCIGGYEGCDCKVSLPRTSTIYEDCTWTPNTVCYPQNDSGKCTRLTDCVGREPGDQCISNPDKLGFPVSGLVVCLKNNCTCNVDYINNQIREKCQTMEWRMAQMALSIAALLGGAPTVAENCRIVTKYYQCAADIITSQCVRFYPVCSTATVTAFEKIGCRACSDVVVPGIVVCDSVFFSSSSNELTIL